MAMETTLKINGQDNASEAIGNVAKSFAAMFLSYEAVKKAVEVGTEVFKKSIEEYTKAEATEAQLVAVLKSTGQAAGVTKESVLQLADAFSQQSTYEEDAIIGAENLLLTFTKIGKDAFPEATKAVVDLSTALGQDLKSSSIQIGKALNDPIAGITALSRVGVSFTAEQKDMIKQLESTGDHLGAQKIILKELQTEFGGSAAAARDTFGGALKALENQTNKDYESLGKFIAVAGRPFVESLNQSAKAIGDYLNSAEGIKTISGTIATIEASMITIQKALKPLGDVIKSAFDTVGIAVKNITSLGDGMKGLVSPLEVLKRLFVFIGTIITADAGAFNILTGILVDFVKILQAAGTVIGDVFSGNLKKAGQDAGKLGDTITTMYTDMVKNAKKAATDTAAAFKKLDKEIQLPVLEKTYNDSYKNISNTIVNGITVGVKSASANAKKETEKLTDELIDNWNKRPGGPFT